MASILKVDTIQDQSGNNIINESADTITIGASGDTITIPTGATLTVPSGGLSGQNYPAFEATRTSNQNLTNDAWVKVTFNSETYDTDDAFTSDTFTVPSGQAGKYYIYGSLRINSSLSSDIADAYLGLYKNGALFRYSQFSTFPAFDIHAAQPAYATVVDAEVGDYYEIYGLVDTSGGTPRAASHSNFGAYRIGD